MEAESYSDPEVANYINQNFIPLTFNIKQKGPAFHQYNALWTPTVILLDANGNERYRIEGYLPRDEFFARLLAGEARLAFMQKRWTDAERINQQIVERFPTSAAAAEAMYWGGVSHYKGTNDHTGLAPLASALKSKYPDSMWTKSASVWA